MMGKVVVPKYVAEFIEVKKEIKSLEDIVRDYDFFSKTLGNLTSWHLSAIEWYVEKPYEFIRAWVEGYEVEEEKYYWRKKKKYLAIFEDEQYLFADEHEKTTVTSIAYASKLGETELINLIGNVDCELFEKVED